MREGWTYKKLGEVCGIQYGFAFDSSFFCEDDNYPQLIRIRDVVRGYSETYYKGAIPEGYYVENGDLLIGMDGEFNIAPWKSEKALLNQRVCKIYAADSTMLERFIYYQMQIILKHIEDETPFVTVKHLSAKKLNSVEFPVPPLSEQQSIVSELDKINELISLKKAQLSDLDALAQSIFYDMFGDLHNTAFSVQTLNDTCEFIKDGTHQTPQYTEDKINGVKFLSAKDVVSGYIDWGNIKFIPYELHSELHKRIAPKRGDILLCKNGTTGICAVVDTDDIFDIYVSLALLRPKTNNMPEYLHYAINNPYTKQQFDDSLKGIGVPNLHLGEIKKTKIIIPPLSLQQEFAKRIELIEQQKAQISSTIKDLETLLASRMQYWFE